MFAYLSQILWSSLTSQEVLSLAHPLLHKLHWFVHFGRSYRYSKVPQRVCMHLTSVEFSTSRYSHHRERIFWIYMIHDVVEAWCHTMAPTVSFLLVISVLCQKWLFLSTHWFQIQLSTYLQEEIYNPICTYRRITSRNGRTSKNFIKNLCADLMKPSCNNLFVEKK